MKALTPCLNFGGNAREAFDFYQSIFGGEITAVLRYRDLQMTAGMPEGDLDRIAHIYLDLGNGLSIIGSDFPDSYKEPYVPGNNVQLTVEPETAEDAKRAFAALSEGGKVNMELEPTEWAELFGDCIDRYGVGWLFNYTGNVQFNPNGAAERQDAAAK